METLNIESIGESSKQRPGVWAVIREAVRGSQRDFTQGSIGQSIFLLSVPMVLEMLMESVFAVVDVSLSESSALMRSLL